MSSLSEKFLNNRNLPPLVSPQMYKSVSAHRRGTLQEETNKGFFRDGSSTQNSGLTNASFATASNTDFRTKVAQMSSSGDPGTGWRGGDGNTVRQIPGVYSPLWLNSNMNLPRDRATINSWLRSFFALNPVVQNAINLHSTYPISKLNIKCANKKVENFFNDMIEETQLMNICIDIAQEYWLLGEAFVYAELDERAAKWSGFRLQNPDYIVVKRGVVANEPTIMLRPDENLRRIVFSNRPSDIMQRNQLNETIIEHVRRGENIPLDNFYVSHLSRKISPYEIRGTGLPVCCFRYLMLWDELYESKYVQANSMINPQTLVKIGSSEYRPTVQDLEAWRHVFEQAEFDRNFKIFTHDGVAVERIGWNGGIIDISNDITQILKIIYTGLMVPQIVMEGGGDITYANGGISLEVLKQRYMSFRNMMANWLKTRVFAPISKLNEFYDHKDGEKKLIIPEVEYNHMSLFETADYINILTQLSGDQKKVSQQTLYRSLGLDYDEERSKMRKEDISEAIRKREAMSLDRMPLNELRALGEDDEIPEILESPLPGMSPYDQATGAGGLPGQTPPGGMDMSMGLSGGPPPMGPPPAPPGPGPGAGPPPPGGPPPA